MTPINGGPEIATGTQVRVGTLLERSLQRSGPAIR